MHKIIDAALDRSRMVVIGLLFILVAGLTAYGSIPKEAEPDVPIPIIYVSLVYQGIAPEDAERLLARPMETELQSIEGLKEMSSTASEGFASVLLEFDAGFDGEKALADVREKVDIAKAELPAGTEEPIVNEVNIALFPVLTVVLSGPLPERSLVNLARDLSDKIEGLPGVLEVDIGGDREELLEVVVDPTVLETYNVTFEELFAQVDRNNQLVAAGALDVGAGRLVLKVPGVIEDLNDLLNLPVKVEGTTVVTFRDVAQVRRTFRDPASFARIDGQPAVALEVSKRLGANIIETIDGIRQLVAAEQARWPGSVKVDYLQDKSEEIVGILADLENNIVSGILLVMIVIVAALGLRSSLLVGLAIPGSFLAGMIILQAIGYTLNIVALFSLILVVGMLVDGAIIVVELADRKMAEGLHRRAAYGYAAKRMAWPVITSTLTTLAVFVPLLFWPGIVGHFMKYLPATVLITLSASLLVALIFTPVLGSMFGKSGASGRRQLEAIRVAESGDLGRIGGFTGGYLRLLRRLARRPGLTLLVAIGLLIGTYVAYGAFGRGMDFFPAIEPDFAQVQVQARGDLSIFERDALVQQVEERILDMPELKSVYARSFGGVASQGRREVPEDTIGVLQLEFVEWDQRRPAAEIMEEVRQRTAGIPGIMVQVREEQQGPGSGKPIQLEISARDPAFLEPVTEEVLARMRQAGGFVDIEDSRPLPGIEWRLTVDREEAARYGADISLLGSAVQMVTEGIKVSDYRPNDADDEVDIRVRFPEEGRNFERLGELRVPTERGQVPISNFVRFAPAPKVGTISRIDGRRTITVKADVAPGLLPNDKVMEMRAALDEVELPPGVHIDFAGEDEEQRETMAFLNGAFLTAIFLMAIILVTQFNRIYQAVLVLSAIVFSTAGVLIGLLVTGQPFGLVMCGIGLIALAGIVVNNNIVLIDTFNALRREGLAPMEAVLRTGAQRLRPVLLTSVTTVLGLMPMVLSMNVDLINRSVSFGSPSTQWWTQLSSAIAGGLAFATLLTLLLTPCLLMLGENLAARWRRRRGKAAVETAPEPARLKAAAE